MALRGSTFYYTSVAAIRQHLEDCLQDINVWEGQWSGEHLVKDKDAKEIFPVEFKLPFSTNIIQYR